jgi:hypothetical protein
VVWLKAAGDIGDEHNDVSMKGESIPVMRKQQQISALRYQRWGKHDQLIVEAIAFDWHATKRITTSKQRHSDDLLSVCNKAIPPATVGMVIDAIAAQEGQTVLPLISTWGPKQTSRHSPGVISQALDDAVAIGHCTINSAHVPVDWRRRCRQHRLNRCDRVQLVGCRAGWKAGSVPSPWVSGLGASIVGSGQAA